MTSIKLTDTVDLDTVAQAVAMYRTATDNAAKWAEIAKQARAQIEDAMGEHDTGTVDGRPVIRWTHVNSNRIDQTLLKERFPQAVAECTTVQTSRRFVLVDPS